ncbi:MAG: RluA family pseudouridine synthase [Salinivirgaceae bacterium]
MSIKKTPKRRIKKSERPPLVFKVIEPVLLMDFLLQNLPGKNRNNIKTLLNDGQIFVNSIRVSVYNHPLAAGQTVEMRWQKKTQTSGFQGIRIIHEDKHLIVIEKDAGVLSIATDTKKQATAYNMLSDYVKKQGGNNKIFVVHRLDRDTSGIMMYARSQKMQEELQRNWHRVVLERTYLAVVSGIPEKPEGTISSYLKENKALIMYSTQNAADGHLAITHYKTLKHSQFYSLLKVNPETGRKNQIRVHCTDMGHPIVGDKKYGSKANPINRLGLHAWVLSFIHPVSKEHLRFESLVPNKFSKLFPEKEKSETKK